MVNTESVLERIVHLPNMQIENFMCYNVLIYNTKLDYFVLVHVSEQLLSGS